MIRRFAFLAALAFAAPGIRAIAAGQSRQEECDRDRHQQGPDRDPAPHRPCAQACRAHQAAHARRLLQQRAVPPRHGRLHGADRRRPEFQRHRRLEISEPEAGILLDPVQARHGRHGAARRQRRIPPMRSSSSASATPPFLNNQYTVIGDVVQGMDVVDKLKKAPPGSSSGTVTDPDKMRQGPGRFRYEVATETAMAASTKISILRLSAAPLLVGLVSRCVGAGHFTEPAGQSAPDPVDHPRSGRPSRPGRPSGQYAPGGLCEAVQLLGTAVSRPGNPDGHYRPGQL